MPEKSDENGYRSILKSSSLFGGVQVLRILINLVRGKFIALILGPEGMGVNSIFNSAFNSVSQFSSLGLNVSFSREMAATKNDAEALGHARYVAGLLLQATSLLGALICMICAPWLSKLSFGSYDYTWQFLLLGVAVYLSVAGDGRLAMLQGLHEVKRVSKASVAGSLSGLVIGVPLYYFFGTAGIVPAITVWTLTTFCFYYYGLRKVAPYRKRAFDKKLHTPLIRKFVIFGILMLAAMVIGSLCTYLLNIYIRTTGNLNDVGLYNAANSITMQYTGAVFAAMSMDYFPRLSAVASDNSKMKLVVNRQIEIVALIATPLAILLIGSSPLLIRLLLSDDFLSTVSLMHWLGLAILFKALYFPLGYIAYAKNNRKLFFWLEGIFGNALFISLALLFYHLYGLIGLGYAVAAEHCICIFIYLAVNYRTYRYRPDRNAVKEILLAVALTIPAFCSCAFIEGNIKYYIVSLIFIVSCLHTFKTLKLRIRTSK